MDARSGVQACPHRYFSFCCFSSHSVRFSLLMRTAVEFKPLATFSSFAFHPLIAILPLLSGTQGRELSLPTATCWLFAFHPLIVRFSRFCMDARSGFKPPHATFSSIHFSSLHCAILPRFKRDVKSGVQAPRYFSFYVRFHPTVRLDSLLQVRDDGREFKPPPLLFLSIRFSSFNCAILPLHAKTHRVAVRLPTLLFNS